MREYDLIADWYATNRDLQMGIPEVRALAHLVEPIRRVRETLNPGRLPSHSPTCN